MGRLAERVTGLEELLTHFERAIGELDGVVRQMQDRLDTLDRRFEAINRHMGELLEEEKDER